MTKSEAIAAIQAEIDAANQRAAGREGHELANASWCVHGLEIALQIVKGLEQFAEDPQRERFEAWVRSTSVATWPHSFDRRGDKYINNWHQARWEAWKSALTWKATK